MGVCIAAKFVTADESLIMQFDPPASGIPLKKGDLRGFNGITPLFKGGYGGIKVRL
jgi:hypothetical protein